MVKTIFEKFSILYLGAHMKGSYSWSWNVHRETAHQGTLSAQDMHIHENFKISVLSDGRSKNSITACIIEEGIHESNHRQNIGMPGCQKYLKSEIDAGS
jgi:hypothetical protein